MANALVGSAKLLAAGNGDRCTHRGFSAACIWPSFGGTSFSFIVRYNHRFADGVPSIVIGIFAYTILVLPQKHFSTLSGGVALGVMMIPIAIRSSEGVSAGGSTVAGRGLDGPWRFQAKCM